MSEPTPLARLCLTLDAIPHAVLNRLPPGVGKRIEELRFQAAAGTCDSDLRVGIRGLATDPNRGWLKRLSFADQARVRSVMKQVTDSGEVATTEEDGS